MFLFLIHLEYKHKDVDIEVQPDADVKVGKTQKQLPTRLVFKKKLQFQDYVTSVCHHKGYTYVAVLRQIARVNPGGSVDESFITCQGDINSVKASDDALVVLLLSPKGILLMYDWTGTPIRTWNVSDEGGNYGSRLSINNNHIHILNASCQRLMVYSFSVALLKAVKSHTFSTDGDVSFTHCGRECLVMTSSEKGVLTLNHQTGQVIKTSKHSFRSAAIASLDGQTVL